MHQFIKALLSSRSRPHLFHFTDVRNADGIRRDGLLSLRELRRRGIAIPAPGGNQWSHDADTRLDLDRFVHLCLFDQHPMEFTARQDGRIERSVFIRIDPAVLNLPGVLFCDEVSNKAGAVVRPLGEIDDYLDPQLVYGYTDWKDAGIQERLKAARKFEILVPDHVPVRLLRSF